MNPLSIIRYIWTRFNIYWRWMYVYVIRVVWFKAKTYTLTDVQVVYQSKNYLVINKEESIRNYSDDDKEITVAKQLQHCFPQLIDTKISTGFRFVHRLDYATSGVMCLALSKSAAKHAGKALEKRQVEKFYLALIRGHMLVDGHQQEVDVGIGHDRTAPEISKMCAASDPNCVSPRSAYTTVYVLEHGSYDREPVTKVLLVPHTGRTHQLRVHCMNLGHRIVGDYTYSNRTDVWPYRMMLHAYKLKLKVNSETIDAAAPDVFTPELDKSWKPDQIIQHAEDVIEHLTVT